MKNMVVNTIATLLLIFFIPTTVCSQGDLLSDITIKENRVSGSAVGCFAAETEHEIYGEIKLDFPQPSNAYPAEILTLGNRNVSKQQMQSALKAAGQSILGKFNNPRGFAIYTGDWNAKANANISPDEAAAQAIEISLRYFEALGIEVDPVPYAISRPYDYVSYMQKQLEYYQHCFSDVSFFVDNAETRWKRQEKFRPYQSEYTCLSFNIRLNGMRLASFTNYPAGYEDEPDAWIGLSVSANATVSDSGILVEASRPLFEIKRRRPIEGEQRYHSFLQQLHAKSHTTIIQASNWEEALNKYLDNMHIRPYQENQPYQNQYMDEPIIQYGSRAVITGLYPVLYTISENEWAPFWEIEIKNEFFDGWRN